MNSSRETQGICQNYNFTDETDADYFIKLYGYSGFDRVIHSIILPLMLTVGILGNLAFLVVVFRIQWMRTITNCYLVNLALADMTFLLTSIGEKLQQYSSTPFVYDDFPKGAIGCVLVPFTKDLCFFSSILFVTCISAERFNAACHPLKQRRDKGPKLRRRTARLTATAWMLSLLMACLRISASCCQFGVYCIIWPDADPYQDYPKFIGECRPPEEWIAYATKSIQLVFFTLAMGINVTLYGRITRAVHCTTARPNARQVPSRTSAIENKITRMVVATGATFFLCLAPFELFSGLMMALPSFNGDMVSAMQVCRMLMHLNSVINPFIYNVASPRYRQAFHLAFTSMHFGSMRRFRQFSRKENSTKTKASSVTVLPRRKSNLQVPTQETCTTGQTKM